VPGRAVVRTLRASGEKAAWCLSQHHVRGLLERPLLASVHARPPRRSHGSMLARSAENIPDAYRARPNTDASHLQSAGSPLCSARRCCGRSGQ
jgi:hypothetical protein